MRRTPVARHPSEIGWKAGTAGVIFFLALFLGCIWLLVRFIHWAWIN
jgi:flagellar biogenesis protein FliO